ncbi:SIR2 family protein [Polyangium sp. 6x1]|uniref:SIR2 family NAD-dependent protein deacylase n=1 Tax=Polyangium sp. 6x1 TaxID=3042689 RepID=UPI0024832A97|nr:SIR2 family protein [Polyangium sp. 6x1]MDI1446950.1 SIR2 family protein [Polyangium sp. 6x1]
MHPSLTELQQAYARGDLVIFAGAGISAGAGLPSWAELVKRLVAHARARGVAEHLLLEVDELVASLQFIDALSALKDAMGGPEFCSFIERQLDDSALPVPPAAKAIAALSANLRAVLTTNVDRILERALAGQWPTFSKATLDVAQRRGFLLKLHGTLHERNTWVFTRADYDRAMYADPQMQTAFSALFHGRTLLFVGYGLTDDDFDQLLARVRALSGDQPPRHFAIVPASSVRAYKRKRLESAGVSLIIYENGDGSHRELTELLVAILPPSERGSVDVADPRRVVRNRIPGASELAQRIADERSENWEIKLFSQLLSDELAASSAERRDLHFGVSFGPPDNLDPKAAISWMSTQFAASIRNIDILKSLVNTGLADAMGPPGQPGDAYKLVYVANRIGQVYREMISWTLRWRRVQTDEAFRPTLQLAQLAGHRLIDRIEEWNQRIATTVREHFEGHNNLPPGTTINLGLVVDLPEGWEEQMQAQMEHLRRRFRW